MFANEYILKGTTTSCSCQINDSCPLPGNLYLYDAWEMYGYYDLNTIETNETLLDLVVNCIPGQTTFASSLECFYNQTCLNVLLSGYQTSINISILNGSIL